MTHDPSPTDITREPKEEHGHKPDQPRVPSTPQPVIPPAPPKPSQPIHRGAPHVQIAIGALLLGAVVGCDRDRDRATSETTVTAAALLTPNEEGIARIAEARCTREEECSNAGLRGPFDSHAGCTAELRPKVAERLGPTACPLGLERKQLDQCLSEVKTEACNRPLDTFDRFVACRSAELCPRVAQ